MTFTWRFVPIYGWGFNCSLIRLCSEEGPFRSWTSLSIRIFPFYGVIQVDLDLPWTVREEWP